MPQVPSNPGPQVSPSGAQPYQQISATPSSFGAEVGRGLQQVGAAGAEMGQVLQSHAENLLKLEANTQGDAAATGWITGHAYEDVEKFRTEVTGPKATQQALSDALGQMEQSRNEAGQGLSPYAKQLYDQQTRNALKAVSGIMSSHVATEAKNWRVRVANDTINAATTLAAQDPTDDNIDNLRRTAATQAGVLSGDVGADPDKLAHSTISASLTQITHITATKDFPKAEAFFEAHKGEFEGKDLEGLTEYMHQRSIPYYAAKVSNDVIGRLEAETQASGGAPMALAALKPELRPVVQAAATKWGVDPNVGAAIIGVETSGGYNVHDNGSSAGVVQLQPPALKDIGFTGDVHDPVQNIDAGMHIIAVKSADLKHRLGRELTAGETFLSSNQGAAGAEALIKAPPGMSAISALEKLMPEADAKRHILKNGGTEDMSAADFVSKWNRRFSGSAQGAGDAMRNMESFRSFALDNIDAEVKAQYGNDPEIRARARSEFETYYNQKYGALKASASSSYSDLTAALLGDPLHNMPGPSTRNELFQIPGMQQAWANLLPEEQKRIDAGLKYNSDQEFKLQHPSVRDLLPGAVQNYRELYGEAMSSPEKFVGRNLASDPRMEGLPVPIQVELIRLQEKRRAGAVAEPAVNRALSVINPQLTQANLDLKTDESRYYQIAGAIAQNVHDYVSMNGGKAPDDLTVKHWATDLLASHGGMFSKTYAFEGEHSTLVAGVPDSAVHSVLADARARGINVSPAEIKAAWDKKNGGK